jgi:hypothetical protein
MWQKIFSFFAGSNWKLFGIATLIYIPIDIIFWATLSFNGININHWLRVPINCVIFWIIWAPLINRKSNTN